MAGSLEECVKLLQGGTDEKRLVGLLLATKFVSGNDAAAIRQLFDAVGMQFINRLIKTGTTEIQHASEQLGQQQGYLHLALTVLAAFSRLPGLASTDEFVDKVPVLVQTLGKKDYEASFGDCCECLLSIAGASERGRVAVHEAQAWLSVAKILYDPSDASWVQVAMTLLSFLLQSHPNKADIAAHRAELVPVVPYIAKQLASQQDLRKFEALSLLRILVSSNIRRVGLSAPQFQPQGEWTNDARSGLGHILQSRVVAEHKQACLELVEAIVEIVGDDWLLGSMTLPHETKPAPRFRFFRVVVEALRVETQSTLHDIAQTLFASGENASQHTPEAAQKLHALATYYALLERVVTMISEEAAEDNQMSESLLEKTFTSVNDIVGVVIELLEGAQEHGLTRGDILLASVRLLGRYLGEAPSAHNQRVLRLLGYLLSVTTEGEERPIHAVSFMLPSLSLMTMDVEGCTALLSCAAHKQIVGFLQTAVDDLDNAPAGIIVGASDVLLNLFVKKNEVPLQLESQDFVPVLPTMASWAGRGASRMENALAGTLSSLVLDLTNEDDLLKKLGAETFNAVIELIALNVEASVRAEDTSESPDDEDLWDITVSGCASCLDRYPSLKHILLSSPVIQSHIASRNVEREFDTTKPGVQLLLASLIRA